MFEELGLNISRQPDNGANPRPDNRSGWLDGETPDLVDAALDERPTVELDVRLWDPVDAAALSQGKAPRAARRRANTGYGRATARAPRQAAPEFRVVRATPGMIEIEARLSELEAIGLYRHTRLVSGPQGPHVLLDGKPVLMLSSNNYLGLADHPRVREAAADAAMRWGVGAGASRLVSGHDDDPPPAGGAAGRRSSAARRARCSAPGSSPTRA